MADEANARADRARVAADGVAEELEDACRGSEEGGKDLQKGTLARAGWTINGDNNCPAQSRFRRSSKVE